MVRTKTWSSRTADAVILTVLGIVACTSLFPIIHTMAVSFSNRTPADENLVYVWPVQFTLNSYHKLLEDGQFFHAFLISVERVLLACSLTFITTVLMAFPLSRESADFPARRYYVWFLVFTMLFNGGLIPWYMTISKMGLINTIWALVLPYAVPQFNIILVMNFFRNLPKELHEAAYVDGANPWYILWRIYIPLSMPALATVTLFTFVSHWNSFFDGLILMNSASQYPLQTYIYELQIQIQNMGQLTSQQLEQLGSISNSTLNAAKLVIDMLPVLVVYPFLQRYFITGITLGSVKE